MIRRVLAPSLCDSPVVAYVTVGGVLLLLVAWGPTPALRNVWWIIVFAVLLALGVTMLRRKTALEFPAIEQAGKRYATSEASERKPTPANGAPPAPTPSIERVETHRRIPDRDDTGHD